MMTTSRHINDIAGRVRNALNDELLTGICHVSSLASSQTVVAKHRSEKSEAKQNLPSKPTFFVHYYYFVCYSLITH